MDAQLCAKHFASGEITWYSWPSLNSTVEARSGPYFTVPMKVPSVFDAQHELYYVKHVSCGFRQ